ncbi:MAG: NADP-dependent phosphogluconate dehydrogenase [Gammaproteobacteria bacterium]
MAAKEAEIGIVGLGAMGANLGWNIAEHGYPVAGLDRSDDKAKAFTAGAPQDRDAASVTATTDAKAFAADLRTPRAIVLLVPAGDVVDSVIESLLPHLDKDDVLIDGGNSHFIDTDRRADDLQRQNIRFIGMGVSGGEDGARHGPSMMPGGDAGGWERVQPVLEAAAAKVDGEPCVAWLGKGSAGHYVKMVHNGIEYGLMELIAEAYDLMGRGLHMSREQIQETFSAWSRGDMASYLMEITADILTKRDPMTDAYLLDEILDAARQKGTGMWTSQEAMENKVPTSIIDAAVAMRNLSDFKAQREQASHELGGPQGQDPRPDGADPFMGALGDALYGAMIMTYVQGMHLLQVGGNARAYGIDLQTVARIWRGGCIIRARLLEDLRAAYARAPDLPNLMFDTTLEKRLQHSLPRLREVVQTAAGWGIPAPALMAALAYYDGYRSARLPANLIQAQRDYFGAHTFERVDRAGTFHAQWE